MLNGPVFLNETIQANARAVNAGGISESLDKANALYSRLSGASFELVPSSFRGGTLYSGVPGVNGDLTWARASDAFRTNADGLIQRVPWNLLLNTNTFSGWSLEGGALTSGFTAPDGTSTAYKYVQTTGGLYSGSATATSGSKTASIWLKSVSGTSITCNLQDGGSGNNTGVTVTGDWQLYTATYTTSTSRPSLYVWGISNASGIYVWHPQLVEGTTAQTYLPTTDRLNFPRLSYMYGSCPSVLLEPQRTNLALQSETFDNASWTKINTTISANTSATLDPSGGNNADKFIANNNNGAHFISQGSFASAAYSFTVYAKAGEETSMSLWLRNAAVGATFNLSNGTVSNISVTSATITSVGNGWYRCFVYDSTAGTTAHIYSRGGSGYIGNNVDGFYIWGAQIEAGAYPTTYIPTTSATATRVADSFSRNNIYTNGLITSSGGTWFVEFRNNVSYTRDTASFFGIGDTSALTTNSLTFLSSVTSRMVLRKYVSGSLSTLYTTTTDTVKIAIKWNGSTADVFVNGTKEVSSTAFSTTNLEFIQANAQDFPKFIQQMALYPSPLSDADCISLTADYTDGTSIVGDYERYVSQKSGAVENLNGVTNLIQNLK